MIDKLQCEGCGKYFDSSELSLGFGFGDCRCRLCILSGEKPKPKYRNPVYGQHIEAVTFHSVEKK